MLQHLYHDGTKLLIILELIDNAQHANRDALQAARFVDEVPSDTEDRYIQCSAPTVYGYASGQCRGKFLTHKVTDYAVDNVQMGIDGLLARLLQSLAEYVDKSLRDRGSSDSEVCLSEHGFRWIMSFDTRENAEICVIFGFVMKRHVDR